MNYDVTALGELLIDFTPSGVNDQGMNLFARNPGGAPANVLAMNNKLGGKTAFIGKVGDDEFGRFLERTLRDSGIDTAGLVVDKALNTTLAFVHLNEAGDRSFSFYRREGADIMFTAAEINRELIANARIFHFGAVSLTGEPCRSAVYAALDCAKAQGKVISYDPNYRPLLWPNEAEAKIEMARPLVLTDILKVSEEEMSLLTGETNLERGAALLAEKGPGIVLVSLGAKGAFCFCADGSATLPTYDVKTIDTTGAGDAFLGAVHYRLRGKTKEQVRFISKEELGDIVDFANAAGSLTTTKKGAIPAMPDMAAIEQCRKSTALFGYSE
ncbi:putative sugar kinase YdjE [Spirochaetia bacterium]|nr:putative sugar kinase YdjE [Spirochaetia bacterium]